MLVSAVIHLASKEQSADAHWTGQLVHGWFLDLVRRQDAALAEELHRGHRHKPFTLSPLRPLDDVSTGRFANQDDDLPHHHSDGQFQIRITSLIHPLSDLLLSLQSEDMATIRLGDAEFAVEQVTTDCTVSPWAGTGDPAALWDRWMGGRKPKGRLRLRFESPTAFETRDSNILFPVPSLIVESVGRKWNEYAPRKIAEEILSELGQVARVEEYGLRTAVAQFTGANGRVFIEKGFVGECEFSVGRHGSREAGRVLHLLAEFAFYAGVGSRTTMGMGQVRARA